MTTFLISLLALFTALLHLWAVYRGPRALTYFAKPTTTGLILFLALRAPPQVSSFYQVAICLGLLFSLAGDIFLMLPTERFVAGMVAFLLAHLIYSVAFGVQIEWPAWSPWGIGLVIYGTLIYRLLQPKLGALWPAVLLYLVAITGMAWLSMISFTQQGTTGALLAMLGALLFVISDSVLALNRFRRHFWSADLLVLSTYYLAQWLIARSV